jgi:hypothetical protein
LYGSLLKFRCSRCALAVRQEADLFRAASEKDRNDWYGD